MSKMLEAGKEVTVKVENLMWPKRHLYAVGVVTQEFNVYTGKVVYEKWYKPNEVGLTTGNPNFPIRVIQRERIVEVDDLPVSYAQPKQEQRIEKVVQGSKGNSYIVTKDAGKITCTCPGFTFRQNCKHTAELA